MSRNLRNAKRTSKWKKQFGGLGAETPAAGSQRGVGGGAPNAAAVFPTFIKNNTF